MRTLNNLLFWQSRKIVNYIFAAPRKKRQNKIDKITLKLQPILQTGHNCKITAIACVDNYFGGLLNFNPLPIHKNAHHHYDKNGLFKNAPLSLRQVSKLVGSIQGELLEINQLTEIGNLIGYQIDAISVESVEAFRQMIKDNLSKQQPLICFFACDRENSLPSMHYDENEHAAVISGYQEQPESVRITHRNQHFWVSLHRLFGSNQLLEKKRKPEYYWDIKHKPEGKQYKYDLVPASKLPMLTNLDVKQSITPGENTGFFGKLMTVSFPNVDNIKNKRTDLTGIIQANRDKKNKVTEFAENNATFFSPGLSHIEKPSRLSSPPSPRL